MDCTWVRGERAQNGAWPKGRGRRTYAEQRPGAADRVQVHLTHGLVVEQGHPEERKAQR